MESEKVKEIKKALEQNLTHFLIYDLGNKYEGKGIQCNLILSYVNELEEANKRLKQSNKNILFVNEKVIEENEQLKSIGLNENITVAEYLREIERLKDKLEKEILCQQKKN
jgi:hypothetical protein